MAIKPTRPHQGRVEDIGPIRGGNDNDRRRLLEAVHLAENLIERLLAFVMSAAKASSAVTSDCVNLIDEDDAG
jgi:hypothetical protein